MTVNPVSRLDRYPIPKVNDLFAKLGQGKLFSKLDLSHEYQQLSLDEESKKYVVVNTHKGLFQYTRLPFGISSAPGIFQRVIESLLQGIEGVVVYLDDILVTGSTEVAHLKALDEVLGRLERAGLRVKRRKCVHATLRDLLGPHDRCRGSASSGQSFRSDQGCSETEVCDRAQVTLRYAFLLQEIPTKPFNDATPTVVDLGSSPGGGIRGLQKAFNIVKLPESFQFISRPHSGLRCL